jgi:acetylornithine deacetylase/succinyl-diaminopimelate desuccinylase-like protein
MTAFDSQLILSEAMEIARIPAPPFGEAARAAHVVGLLGAVPGWTVRTDKVGNIIVAPTSTVASRALWVLIHLDTVFGESTALEFSSGNGVAFGPGIGDNAVAIAAGLAVMRALPFPPGTPPALVFAFTVGEESHGNLRGARRLLESEGADKASAVIALEGHRGDELGTVMVGSARFRLTVRRQGGHSWWDRGRPTAIHDLVRFSSDLLEQSSKICPDVAVNIGVFRGGTGMTALAPEATIEFEGRAPATVAVEAFAGLVQQLVTDLGGSASLEEIGRRPGGSIADNHPLVLHAQEARRLAGLADAPLGSSSSDANPFIDAGIPSLTLGITGGRNAHQIDEEIDILPIAAGTAALAHLITRLTAPDFLGRRQG